MRNVCLVLLFLIVTPYVFAQESIKEDSLKPEHIEYEKEAFESDMIIQDTPALIDFSLPEVQYRIKYPLLYMDVRCSNDFPALSEINYRRGHFFSKQINRFYLQERSFATLIGLTIDSNIDYQFSDDFSLDFIRVHNSNIYNNPLLPDSRYRERFGLGLSLKIAPKLKIKTGLEGVLYQGTGKWGLLQMNTFKYGF